MMTATEILTEIRHLPISEKNNLFRTLEVEYNQNNEISEEERLEQEVDKLLLAEGIIKKIPPRWNDDDDFEPIEFSGKPISETLLEDRD